MSPKVIDKYSDYRKEQILHASWDCFVELGYKKTNLRTIAKRMNATTGVIYTYFKSKDELIEALLTYNSRKGKNLIENISKEHKGEDAIKEIYKSLFEQLPLDASSKIIRGSFDIWSKAMEKKKSRDILSSSWKDIQRSIEQFIKKGIKKGEFKKDLDSKTMAGFIVVILLGLQVQIMLMGESITPSYLDKIKKVALKAMK